MDLLLMAASLILMLSTPLLLWFGGKFIVNLTDATRTMASTYQMQVSDLYKQVGELHIRVAQLESNIREYGCMRLDCIHRVRVGAPPPIGGISG